jgi:hypothetical protein
MLPSIILLKMRVKPKQAKISLSPTSLENIPYFLVLLMALMVFAAIYTPVLYMSQWGISRDDIPASLWNCTIVVMNATVTIGRFLLSRVAHRATGMVNMCVILIVVFGLMCFCWVTLPSKEGLFAFVAIYGFWLGGGLTLISLTPVCFTTDLSRMGARVGTACFFAGIGFLFGSPSAETLVSSSPSYTHMHILVAFLVGEVSSLVPQECFGLNKS